MENSILSSFVTAGLTLLAYVAVPILFSVLYPNRLRPLFCWIFGIVHGGLVFLFFRYLGLSSLLFLLLAIGQALIWSAAGAFVMSRIALSKLERTENFVNGELKWYKRDTAVRLMSVSLFVCEFAVYAVMIMRSVK